MVKWRSILSHETVRHINKGVEMKWISVKDKLPKTLSTHAEGYYKYKSISDYVLCFSDFESIPVICELRLTENNEHEWHERHVARYPSLIHDVTYWMPLPNDPIKE